LHWAYRYFYGLCRYRFFFNGSNCFTITVYPFFRMSIELTQWNEEMKN
jgi:hypothetical protein